MKKYIVKFKESKKALSEYASREEASAKIMEFINDVNKSLNIDYLSPFDFELEEVECKEVNEVITDFETARKVLGIRPLEGIIVSKRLEDVERFVHEINPKHLEALIALNRLFTIAEAWNKEDGFIPDFSDGNQYKYFPWFPYGEWTKGFVHTSTNYMFRFAYLGPLLCFKTRERAQQFGNQFIDLFNKIFLQ